LTLSASQLEPKSTPGPELEEETPVKASQNAFPSFLRIVCEAIAANIACACCTCGSPLSLCWFSLLLARPFACNTGGVGYPADEKEDAACFPESKAVRVLLLDEDEYGILGFDEEEKK